jgi:uncharacterized protein (TIGR02452 family)
MKPKTIATETLHELEQGYYTNDQGQQVSLLASLEKAVAGTRTFTPQELPLVLPEYTAQNTQFEAVNETTLNAVRRLRAEGEWNILCLNFASAKNPGGGFLNGAVAQEESIARASGLYPCLVKDWTYYEVHRGMKSCLYTHHMIYSPDVPVFKFEKGAPMDELVLVSVITSAAVNAGVVHRLAPEEVPQIEPQMRQRVQAVLSVAAALGHEALVLGAWGCGVFRNDPAMIARLFDEALNSEFKGRFRRVVFAVFTKSEDMIAPFETYFNRP